ncbi:putative HTH-type transcriptional regulator [Defluviimonas aquaemixtae]|uniref:Putative HTH-type transcriptional regulator n=1 Tax=Albidovulum aquaemixtae TaxID=1542388 RepID=A0A2R8B7G0_9RHOB|nr:LysR family transcriptional regulator ArgP [Defluviimonas aquaemixtae]SPH18545.1 putative HTH-type transcriptional regulator [Defluviimonas aquaemixtae]
MIDPGQLRALALILRTGSFEAAAEALHVTPSAVSQRIRALEDRLGTTLVIRAQPARATEAGARLARHAEDMELLEQALAADLGADLGGERPSVRIAVNADSLATWVLPALTAMADVLYDIVTDDQDHSADWLRRGAVQAAVTSQGAPIAGCDTFPLGALRYIATASPEFVQRWFARGLDADSLSRAPALVFNRKDALQTQWTERLVGKRLPLTAHYVPSSHAFVEAALVGLGWGMNPEPLVEGHLRDGSLVAIAPDAPMEVVLHWQVGRLSARALAPLTQAIRQAAGAYLVPV